MIDYAEDEKLLAPEHKFELSEMHRITDDMKSVVQMDSFLREQVTNTTLSCDRKSVGDAEQISQVLPNLDSKEESSGADITLNEMFEHTNEESSNSGSQTAVVISREGMRRQKKTTACINANSYRQRKSDDQVKILADLYQKHNGKLNRKVRKEAMAKTGLAWIQIYKWFFDRQLKKSAMEKACFTQYPGQIFRVIGKDGQEIGKP